MGLVGHKGWPGRLPAVALRLVSAAPVQAFLHGWLPVGLFAPLPTPPPPPSRFLPTTLPTDIGSVLFFCVVGGRGEGCVDDWFTRYAPAAYPPKWGRGRVGVTCPRASSRLGVCADAVYTARCFVVRRCGSLWWPPSSRAPPASVPTATTTVPLWWGRAAGWVGVGTGAACRPYSSVVGAALPGHSGRRCGRVAHVWGVPSEVAAAVEGRGGGTCVGRCVARRRSALLRWLPLLRLSASPLLAVGVGGGDVSARHPAEPLRRRPPGGSAGGSAFRSCTVRE